MSGYRPFNQETDPSMNAEPGIALVPGSRFLHEVSKHEQFAGRYTQGTNGPGNPYVYRPFPKMVYRAEHWNGKVCCMAARPDPTEFKDTREAERAEVMAQHFTEKCQKTVRDETELARAMESGWRETPAEAVEHVLARDRAEADATAERNYQDRNMSAAARREVAEVEAAAGGEHQPEITGRKVAEAKDQRRRRGAQ
jgi:hypothetical protein